MDEAVAVESRRESQAPEEKLRKAKHPWVEALKDANGDATGALSPQAQG